jgi:hypothetical protein
MPDAPEAARQHLHQEAPDKCVGVAPHGLDTIALTPIAVGDADPPVTHVEEPVVRDGDAMCLAADRVQDVGRAGPGGLGVDAPRLGIELIAKRCQARGDAPHWGTLREGHGAGGACLGQRRTARAAQDRPQGPHRQEEAAIGIAPALPAGGPRQPR